MPFSATCKGFLASSKTQCVFMRCGQAYPRFALDGARHTTTPNFGHFVMICIRLAFSCAGMEKDRKTPRVFCRSFILSLSRGSGPCQSCLYWRCSLALLYLHPRGCTCHDEGGRYDSVQHDAVCSNFTFLTAARCLSPFYILQIKRLRCRVFGKTCTHQCKQAK